jgi:hypothetical protein
MVWDYGVDTVTVVRRRLGVVTCMATYNVDRRQVSPDHYLILFSPIRKWSGFWCITSSQFFTGNLKHLNPLVGDFVRLECITKDGTEVSTALVGQKSASRTSRTVDDAIANLAAVGKINLTVGTVESMLGKHLVEKSTAEIKQQAAILTRFHREHTGPIKTRVFPVTDAVRRYQYGDYEQEARPSMIAFMSPLIHEGFAPDRTYGNDQRGVKGRITDVVSTKDTTAFISRCMQDFVTALIPEPHLAVPVTDDEVYEKQNRPTQIAKLKAAEVTTGPFKRYVASFAKTEAYSSAKDLRLISTINDVDKLNYSKYMYPLADHLKSFPWYAFGKTPFEIAETVARICQTAETVHKTDFHRMDGTIAPVLRELERMVLVRFYHTDYTADLIEIHGSQYNLRARTSQGARYNTGTARLSGSAETTPFNTFDSLFSTYLTYRRQRLNGASTTHEYAWSRCTAGIYGGDDGLAPDLPGDIYVKACASLGLQVELEVVNRGDFGVQFLSRVYGPGVWHGDPNSCCDLMRQLSKIHLTAKLPDNVSPMMKLAQKARGFILSDAETPIIGQYALVAVNVTEDVETPESMSSARSWLSKFPADVQYPNYLDIWMEDYASSLDLDLEDFDSQLAIAQYEPEQLLKMSLLKEPKTPLATTEPVVVDDFLISPDTPPHESSKQLKKHSPNPVQETTLEDTKGSKRTKKTNKQTERSKRGRNESQIPKLKPGPKAKKLKVFTPTEPLPLDLGFKLDGLSLNTRPKSPTYSAVTPPMSPKTTATDTLSKTVESNK